MGLDQYAGLRDSNGKVHIDFENVYSDKYDPNSICMAKARQTAGVYGTC